jgi:uncharacterized protein (DUF1697 family)
VTAYIALLRGMNVAGKNKLRMADLKAIAEKLGLGGARTFIASGNLLFESGKPEEELRAMLEERLAAHMGKPVGVILRTATEMALVVRANPFPDAAAKGVLTFFLSEAPPTDLLDRLRNQDDERVAAGVREVFVAYGETGIARSRLRIPGVEAGTARNMNTVARLAELAKEME